MKVPSMLPYFPSIPTVSAFAAHSVLPVCPAHTLPCVCTQKYDVRCEVRKKINFADSKDREVTVP